MIPLLFCLRLRNLLYSQHSMAVTYNTILDVDTRVSTPGWELQTWKALRSKVKEQSKTVTLKGTDPSPSPPSDGGFCF